MKKNLGEVVFTIADPNPFGVWGADGKFRITDPNPSDPSGRFRITDPRGFMITDPRGPESNVAPSSESLPDTGRFEITDPKERGNETFRVTDPDPNRFQITDPSAFLRREHPESDAESEETGGGSASSVSGEPARGSVLIFPNRQIAYGVRIEHRADGSVHVILLAKDA